MQKKMPKVWNTWSDDNMLSHVHLPDNLAFKHVGSPAYMTSAVKHVPDKTRLGMRSNFGSYTSMV